VNTVNVTEFHPDGRLVMGPAPRPEVDLAKLRAMTHEQLVGEVVAARLGKANAERLLHVELGHKEATPIRELALTKLQIIEDLLTQVDRAARLLGSGAIETEEMREHLYRLRSRWCNPPPVRSLRSAAMRPIHTGD